MMHAKIKIQDLTGSDNPCQALTSAARDSTPGTWLIYFRDWHLWDEPLAETARTLADRGRVVLCQRRLHSSRSAKFEYIAVTRCRASNRT